MTDQTGQHEPSAAERAALHGPPPAADPGAEHAERMARAAADRAEPDPQPAEPGPCTDCAKAGRADMILAVVALGVAAVIAVMAVDLMTGGRLAAVFGPPPRDDNGD